MADPRIVDGVPALLFDRLIDLEPKSGAEADVFRHLSTDDLKSSIRREIGRLLDTRRPVPVDHVLKETDPTVLDYGVPDFLGINPESPTERRRLAAAIERVLAAFEPRLIDPQVTAEPHPQRRSALMLRLGGRIRVGAHMEDVWFPIELDVKAFQRTEA